MGNKIMKSKKIKQPKQQDISSHALELLITAYIRINMNENKRKSDENHEIPKDILILFIKYYPSQLYMIILNQINLKLTLCDISKNNVAISSNNVVEYNELNKSNESCRNFGGILRVGLCHKTGIKFKHKLKQYNNHNAIFKCGGDIRIEDQNLYDIKDCGLILYPRNIDNIETFSTHYYQLPSFPFKLTRDDNFKYPIYSNVHGLTLFTNTFNNKEYESQIVNLNIDSEILNWNVTKLPSEISNYSTIPTHCYINNDKELFIVNGKKNENDEICKETIIYNLENNKCISLEENPYSPWDCQIKYCNYTNKIFLGETKSVFEYDLYKNEYFDNLPETQNGYMNPLIWLNENGTIIHIANPGQSYSYYNINYEWIDLRAPSKWMKNDNLIELQWKIWTKEQFQEECMYVIGWQ
eukprot:177518_1